MKVVKLYLTAGDILEKLGDEYKGNAVLFTKAEIGNDNTLTFECLVTEAEKMTRSERRERLINPDENQILLNNAKILSNISGMSLGESVDYLNNVIATFNLK